MVRMYFYCKHYPVRNIERRGNALSKGGDCNLYLKVTRGRLCGSAACWRPLLARDEISSALYLLFNSDRFYQPPTVCATSATKSVIQFVQTQISHPKLSLSHLEVMNLLTKNTIFYFILLFIFFCDVFLNGNIF